MIVCDTMHIGAGFTIVAWINISNYDKVIKDFSLKEKKSWHYAYLHCLLSWFPGMINMLHSPHFIVKLQRKCNHVSNCIHIGNTCFEEPISLESYKPQKMDSELLHTIPPFFCVKWHKHSQFNMWSQLAIAEQQQNILTLWDGSELVETIDN